MKSICYQFIADLQNYKRSKSDVMRECVQERLNDSYAVYTQEIDQAIDYLERRKNITSVSRKLTKRLNEKTKL